MHGVNKMKECRSSLFGGCVIYERCLVWRNQWRKFTEFYWILLNFTKNSLKKLGRVSTFRTKGPLWRFTKHLLISTPQFGFKIVSHMNHSNEIHFLPNNLSYFCQWLWQHCGISPLQSSLSLIPAAKLCYSQQEMHLIRLAWSYNNLVFPDHPNIINIRYIHSPPLFFYLFLKCIICYIVPVWWQ